LIFYLGDAVTFIFEIQQLVHDTMFFQRPDHIGHILWRNIWILPALNRTFLWEASFDPAFNPEYDALNPIVNPDKPIGNLLLSSLNFYMNLAWRVIKKGWPALKHTLLLGQYRNPKGLFYGGEGYQEETRALIDLYRRAFSAYDQILHLDMHTGYGPRDRPRNWKRRLVILWSWQPTRKSFMPSKVT
jgi:hypothetical protein